MKNAIGVSVLLYGFVLLQTSVLVHIVPHGFVPNLVLLAVVCISMFEKPESYTSFVAACVGGILLDVFSTGVFGMWLAILLMISEIIRFVFHRYVQFFIPQLF